MPEKEPPTKKPADEKPTEKLLRDRWIGQEERIHRIIESARKGEDWTVHLDGLPFVEEVEALPNEKFGRDRRGAEESFYRGRWIGEEDKIPEIVEAIQEKQDWTAHLEGLPFVDDINSIYNEKYGRDLRGVNLTSYDLKGARLSYTRLDWAYLIKTELNGAALNGANLSYTNLSGGNFTGAILIEANLKESVFGAADFAEANLRKADLSGANLWKADLKGADLNGANLKEAALAQAEFQGADLQDAELANAKGLLAGQLGGANVCNAKLPEEIKKFKAIGHVGEASKNARKIFLTMLLGCVYSWLTIATTTDPRLLTNSSSSPLPIIGTAIPIVGFYLAAPILLFGFYIYFHLCMQRLWEGLANLPAIFPDGRPLDERAYPWLLTGLVRVHFARLKDKRPPFSRLQEMVSIFLAWWMVPLTMFLFWWRHIYRHHWAGTFLHILLLGLSILFGIAFYRLTVRTLNGEGLRNPHNVTTPAPDPGSVKGFRLKDRSQNIIGWLRLLMEELQRNLEISRDVLIRRAEIFLALFLFLSLSAISGMPLVGSWASADFTEADVSTKPANWTGKEIILVKGAKLREANLRYCLAYKAFLIYADLRDADLKDADLRFADLTGARLSGANLSGARLRGANLNGANLYDADLSGANLSGARLRGANLNGANLRLANLNFADLRYATLLDAYLIGADLVYARLNGTHLNRADLRRANLKRADLYDADLSGTAFRYAYLKDADLGNADLSEADLRETTGLTEEQIRSAIIDEDTQLPKHLEHLKEELLKAQRERLAAEAKRKVQAREEKNP